MAWLLRLSAVALAALLLVPASASAATQDEKRLDRTVGYLQRIQNKDGGFGKPRSEPGFSAWAAYALAADGVNPRDQKRPGGVSVYTYLTSHTSELEQTTDFARVLLVAAAAGTPPQRFGGINPLKRMLAHQQRDGSFPQLPRDGLFKLNGTAFAILAMAGVQDSVDPATRADLRERQGRAVNWLLRNQEEDGSWRAAGSGSTDLTAAAVEALNAAGRRGTAAQRRALAYLRGTQNPDGGLGDRPGASSNTNSTAWVARALAAAGVDARTWRAPTTGNDPLQYLASMQQTDGSVRYSATQDRNRIWVTADAAPALAGAALPIAEVDREDNKNLLRKPRSDKPTRIRGEDGTQPGAGGVADGGDGDVIAGGGGEGAPLYSQPEPGSLGVQPGGARDTEQPSTSTGEGEGQVAGESVAGKLVGQGTLATAGKGRSLGSAPGLKAAAAGGQAPTWLVVAIGIALILSALGGVYLERRGTKGRAS